MRALYEKPHSYMTYIAIPPCFTPRNDDQLSGDHVAIARAHAAKTFISPWAWRVFVNLENATTGGGHVDDDGDCVCRGVALPGRFPCVAGMNYAFVDGDLGSVSR